MTISMRRLAGFIAVFLLLSSAAPLLACMTGRAMNREESACCRSMHGQCGEMAKMGCCRTDNRIGEHPQLAATAPPADVQLAVISWLSPSIAATQDVSPFLLRIPDEHSPPGIVTAQTTVLRI